MNSGDELVTCMCVTDSMTPGLWFGTLHGRNGEAH
jgi:hypothetical protein